VALSDESKKDFERSWLQISAKWGLTPEEIGSQDCRVAFWLNEYEVQA